MKAHVQEHYLLLNVQARHAVPLRMLCLYEIAALYAQVWRKDTTMRVNGILKGMDKEVYSTQSAHAPLVTCVYKPDRAMTSGVEEGHQDEGGWYTHAHG